MLLFTALKITRLPLFLVKEHLAKYFNLLYCYMLAISINSNCYKPVKAPGFARAILQNIVVSSNLIQHKVELSAV